MAQTPKLEYTGTWIPAHVMEDRDLSSTAKILYALIAGFKTCYASNKWLGDKLGLKERAVRQNLELLEGKGFVLRAEEDHQRYLVAVRDDPMQKIAGGGGKKLPGGRQQNAANNIVDNKEENPTGSSAGANAPAPATPSDSILTEPPQKVPRKRGSTICAFHSKHGEPGANCRDCGTNQRTVNEVANQDLVHTKTSPEPPTTHALHYRVIKKYGLPVSNHLHVKAKSKAFDAEIGPEAAQAYLQRLLDVDYTGIPGEFKPELNHSRDIYDKRIKITAFLDQHAPIQKRPFDSIAWGKEQEERARRRRIELGFEGLEDANN